MSQVTVKRLSIFTGKNRLPDSVYAEFSDGRHLALDYQVTWAQCFATLSRGRGIECEYRRHMPSGVSPTEFDRKDWAEICLRFYRELTGGLK